MGIYMRESDLERKYERIVRVVEERRLIEACMAVMENHGTAPNKRRNGSYSDDIVKIAYASKINDLAVYDLSKERDNLVFNVISNGQVEYLDPDLRLTYPNFDGNNIIVYKPGPAWEHHVLRLSSLTRESLAEQEHSEQSPVDNEIPQTLVDDLRSRFPSVFPENL